MDRDTAGMVFDLSCVLTQHLTSKVISGVIFKAGPKRINEPLKRSF